MNRYDKIMVPVTIYAYQKSDERQVSLPILSPDGLVNQMFFFDCNDYDEKGYKALQEQSNVIVLTEDELLDLMQESIEHSYPTLRRSEAAELLKAKLANQ